MSNYKLVDEESEDPVRRGIRPADRYFSYLFLMLRVVQFGFVFVAQAYGEMAEHGEESASSVLGTIVSGTGAIYTFFFIFHAWHSKRFHIYPFEAIPVVLCIATGYWNALVAKCTELPCYQLILGYLLLALGAWFLLLAALTAAYRRLGNPPSDFEWEMLSIK